MPAALALAAFLAWLGHRARIRPWGLFALYIAIIVTVAGLAWFAIAQRRPDRPVIVSVSSAAASGEPAAREGDQEGEAEPGRVTTTRSDEWQHSLPHWERAGRVTVPGWVPASSAQSCPASAGRSARPSRPPSSTGQLPASTPPASRTPGTQGHRMRLRRAGLPPGWWNAPAAPGRPVLTRGLIAWLAFTGLLTAAGTLGVISWADHVHGLAVPRTMGMVTFALFSLFFSIESKDERDSAFSLGTFSVMDTTRLDVRNG
jgi:hypothetical protein